MGKDKKKSDKKQDKKKSAKGSAKTKSQAVKSSAAKATKKQKVRAAKSPAQKPAKQPPAPAAAVSPTLFRDALRMDTGSDLSAVDTRSTPGFTGDKAAGEATLADLAGVVSDLQERLFAESTAGGERSILLVVQGMDTSGKGGIMRHVVGAVDPQGVDITSFKAPTAQEQEHPFLWRIRQALPAPGQIGVFDRSHYEDVLIVRVHDLVPRAQWARRYGQINTFEKSIADKGTTIIKVMLHVSQDEQKERLTERLDRDDKHWKFNPADIDERAHWDDYQEAYQAVIDKCSTETAPWYVVPADRKWYARLAVMNLLREHLQDLDPQWPSADFDVAAEQERLAQS